MKNRALTQAKERLERCRKAVSAMESACIFALGPGYETLQPFEPARRRRECDVAWSSFILSASTIYSKLEQGAKGSGVSEGWFGRKKHDRKTDELLRYIHHARNSDEHSIEPIHEIALTVKADQGLEYLGFIGHKNKEPILRTLAKPGIKLRFDFFELITVKDKRYGDLFDPPKTHLGKSISGTSPYEAMQLSFTYYESLLAEAGKLPQIL